jgi:hypothetical protein
MNLLSGLSAAQIDLITGVLSFVVTIALLSYLIGDNPLYRVGLHLFIGVSIGYIALVVTYQVIFPRLIVPLVSGDFIVAVLALVPLVLFGFLAFKLSPVWSPVGNVAVAYLIGVGAAVAVGGAITGTLLPQVEASWLPLSSDNIAAAVVLLVGTVTALFYFQFTQRKQTGSPPVTFARQVGKGFIVFTLGMLYGGLILSGIAVFASHINQLVAFVSSVLS